MAAPGALVPHPPLAWFLEALEFERVWGQLWVQRNPGGRGFEVRHVADREVDAASLREVTIPELRRLGQFDLAGTYRPLPSAPTLVGGWRYEARTAPDLAQAIQTLYPGSLADAWVMATGATKPARFEDVAARQLGKARQLQDLRGTPLVDAAAAGCGPASCLKRRCWTADGLAAEDGAGKSAIPCLDPCAVFLGFARACVAMDQQPRVPAEFAPDDLATMLAAVRHAAVAPPAGIAEGDLMHPLNARRLARVTERYRALWARVESNDRSFHEERD